MAEIIRMPRLSDTMEEGNIIAWLKNEGDQVSPGDILAEVETDKATMDLESFHEGVLLHIGVKEGAVPVDAVIAVIGEKGEDVSAILQEAGNASTTDNSSSPEPEQSAESAPETGTQAEAPTPSSGSDDDSRIKASPLAKKIAQENDIGLSGLSGSGEGGRIVKKDIEKAISEKSSGTTQSSISIPASGGTSELPLSQMRKTIARRLSESKFTAPHFYLTVDVNMERAAEARKAINALGKVKISFNDIVVKACALALRQHPMVNASWTNEKIILHGDINIGVAVAVEEGLVVPVLKRADYMPMSQINEQVKDMAGRARNKKIKTDELQGNTFTISNLGMFGIEEFTAIINPPDACILAVGAIIEKPIVVEGNIKVAKMMKITLSCDHRIVDGAKGAEFVQTVKANLENPLHMLV